MSFVKYATAEILEVKTSKTRLPYEYGAEPGTTFQKFAALEDTGDTNGYLYVRTRAISSRVNKNNDGWPSDELARGYKTFVGRPLFVDHNNDDPKRTRGVVLDARLFVDEGEKTSALDPYYASAPAAHLPPTHIETISEVDAQTFPKLAEAIRTGKVNSVSMGANIETSVCSVCDNVASTPKQYCAHIKDGKGRDFEVTSADGSVAKRKAYEDCIGVNFFEQSFVFDPADETAYFTEPVAEERMVFAKTGAGLKTDVNQPGDEGPNDKIKNNFPNGEKPSTKKPRTDSVAAPERVDTLSNDLICPNCESDDLQEDPDQIWRCPTCEYELPPDGFRAPDLEAAREMDLKQKVDSQPNADGEEETPMAGEGADDVTFDDDKNKKKLGPVAPVQPMSRTINNNKSNGIISEMNWKTKPENVDFVVQYLAKTGAAVDNENLVARRLLESYGRERLTAAALTRLEIAEGIEKFATRKEATTQTLTLPAVASIHNISVGIFQGLARLGGMTASVLVHDAAKSEWGQGFAGKSPETTQGMTVVGDDINIDLNQVTGKVQNVLISTGKLNGNDQVVVDLTVNPDQAYPFVERLFVSGGNTEIWQQIGQALQANDPQTAMGLLGKTAAAKPPVKRKPINPRQPQSTKDEKIVSDQLKPVEADRRVIEREESENEEGVTRKEVITEETGSIGASSDDSPKAEETSEEPKAESNEDTSAESTQAEPQASEDKEEESSEKPWEKKKEPAYASTKSESNLLLAMEVAKLASSLGVIPAKEELSYAAELEQKSADVIKDRLETLQGMKTAGVFTKQARFAQVPQVPRLARTNGAVTPEGKTSVEEYLSEIFD